LGTSPPKKGFGDWRVRFLRNIFDRSWGPHLPKKVFGYMEVGPAPKQSSVKKSKIFDKEIQKRIKKE